MTKVSIIIPAYNSAISLKQCVDSVLAQDYENIEVIIVNDGSTDDTSKIAHDIAKKNKNIIVIDQENRGLGEARNSGVAISSGDYAIFLDSDDLLLPWSVSEMLGIAIREKADIVCGGMLETPRPAEEYDRMTKEGKAILEYEKLSDGYRELLYMKVLPSAHAKIYNLKLIKNERFSKIRHAEDLEYNLRIFKKAKKVFTMNSPVVEIYALSSGSMMRSAYNDKKHEELQILQGLAEKHSKTKNNELKKAYAASIFFHSIGLARMIYGDNEAISKYAEDYSLLKKYIKNYSRSVAFDKAALASQRKYALAAIVSVNLMLKMMARAEHS